MIRNYLLIFAFLCSVYVTAQEHPSLILTKEGVKEIREHLGSVPLFDRTLDKTKREVDLEIEKGILVPIPKDFSGGHTHQVHKKNFLILQKAGVLFQILEEEKYAIYVRDMLMEYARIYPTLPLHPKKRSYARGKIFWQCLNDSNWLVYTSQAYDCIYDWLSKKEREKLENDLFIPYANFISEGNPQFYNRVHNHSTWGNVAVGMIGLVMDDDGLIERALYGLKEDSIEEGLKDDDGGFIKVKGQKAGFLANLDEPFSPDGYYTEGPYYQRYAMYPFLIFAQALNNVKPEYKIFEYKDGVLLNAVDALLNLSDSDGEFYPINDGQKGMSIHSRSLISAVDIAYHFGDQNPELLSIAKIQDQVVLNDAGLSVARSIEKGLAKPFRKKSVEFKDGSKGDQGGLSILRNKNMELIFKYSAQGLSHGHYDKLSFSLYEDGNEVLQDYGLARFVNIEQKGGGNYLKENTTWAKQTIAHNTIVQNEESHFKGKYEIGSKNHSKKLYSNISDIKNQYAGAYEFNAYPDTRLKRTLVMIEDDKFERPFILDVFNIQSKSNNQYDLPYYFIGQVISVNFDYESSETLQKLGSKNGYEHLWIEGKGKPSSPNTKLSWLNNGKYYTLTSATELDDELVFVRLGSEDPEFNLRRDPGFIIRRNNIQNTNFVNIIETHGSYSPVSEFSSNSKSNVKKVGIVHSDENYIAIEMELVNDKKRTIILSLNEQDKNNKNQLEFNGTVYKWTGPYYYIH